LTQQKNIKQLFSHNIPIVDDIKEANNFEVTVLVSYGKLLKREEILDYPTFFLNVHNSLLPKYRGLHAFSWAIINGEEYLGYTLHVIEEGIDNGAIVSQIKFKLLENEDVNDAFRKGRSVLKYWLSDVLSSLTWEKLSRAIPQDEREATYVVRRKEEDNRINWNQKCIEIYNLIRAVAPPYTKGAFFFVKDRKIYVKKAQLLDYSPYICIPGAVVIINENGLGVKCKDSILKLEKLIVDEKEIEIPKFIKAFNIKLGTRLR
jgi:methionyl-tRNA formyltransferase